MTCTQTRQTLAGIIYFIFCADWICDYCDVAMIRAIVTLAPVCGGRIHDKEKDGGCPFYHNPLSTEIPSVRCDTSKKHPKR